MNPIRSLRSPALAICRPTFGVSVLTVLMPTNSSSRTRAFTSTKSTYSGVTTRLPGTYREGGGRVVPHSCRRCVAWLQVAVGSTIAAQAWHSGPRCMYKRSFASSWLCGQLAAAGRVATGEQGHAPLGKLLVGRRVRAASTPPAR